MPTQLNDQRSLSQINGLKNIFLPKKSKLILLIFYLFVTFIYIKNSKNYRSKIEFDL